VEWWGVPDIFGALVELGARFDIPTELTTR
jgi:hypothetical protein